MNFSLFALVMTAVLAVAETVTQEPLNMAVDVPEKLQLGRPVRRVNCQAYCPECKAVPFVAELDALFTTYVQMKQWDYAQQLVSSTGTYTIVKPGCGSINCYKFTGGLSASMMYGNVECYDFEPEEFTYQSNGVVVVRGTETVRRCKEILFKGEVNRYYVADCGCNYKLELVIGADQRCVDLCIPPVVPADSSSSSSSSSSHCGCRFPRV